MARRSCKPSLLLCVAALLAWTSVWHLGGSAQQLPLVLQYEEGRYEQVLANVKQLGYTVLRNAPQARTLYLELPPGQQAAMDRALSMALVSSTAAGASVMAVPGSPASSPASLGGSSSAASALLAGDTLTGAPVFEPTVKQPTADSSAAPAMEVAALPKSGSAIIGLARRRRTLPASFSAPTRSGGSPSEEDYGSEPESAGNFQWSDIAAATSTLPPPPPPSAPPPPPTAPQDAAPPASAPMAAAVAGVLAATAAPYVATAAQQLGSIPGVASAQRDGIRYLMVSNPSMSPPGARPAGTGSSSSSSLGTTGDCSNSLDDRSSGRGMEVVPWGVTAVQALDPLVLGLGRNASRDLLICTIDTGVDTTVASDLPVALAGCLPQVTPRYCKYAWNASYGAFHGSHVVGTVGARLNGLGVVGVASGNASIYHINLFGDSSVVFDLDIMNAMDGCVAAHEARRARNSRARLVISMSLGGIDPRSEAFEAYASSLMSRGDTLIFAASGNFGNASMVYPAGYTDVISVAASWKDGSHPDFSTHNADVELTGPGQGVLSYLPNQVVPGTGAYAVGRVATLGSITATGARIGTKSLISPLVAVPAGAPYANITGRLVDCGLGLAPCQNAAGAICLLQRGQSLFCDKVLNCSAGGGVGAILYNAPGSANCDPLTAITLNSGVCAAAGAALLPTVAISYQEGANLAAAAAAGPVSVSLTSTALSTALPMGYLKGTSMAAPHVSAVAALVWSAFTACPGHTIRAALKAAALDLGTPGTDEEFGAGLVQARAAYAYLLAHPCAKAAWPARRYLPPPPAASPPLRPPPPPPSPRPVPPPSSSRQGQSGARRSPPPPVATRRTPAASRRSPPPPPPLGARRAQVLSVTRSRTQNVPWVRSAAEPA